MRWLPRLLSHSIEVGRASAAGRSNPSLVKAGSHGFASGGWDGSPAVPREWLRKLWVDVLKKQKEDARRWGIGASPGNAGSGAEPSLCAFANSVEAAGATREAPSRSYQYEYRGLAGVPLYCFALILSWVLLRTRRPFVAEITDAMGNEIFKVRRPFWWINSSIYAEVDGKEIGVVHRRWHLWQRIYDLYLGNRQFAVVENPGFWNWTFSLVDEDDKLLAQIDRNWRGIGFEPFIQYWALPLPDDTAMMVLSHKSQQIHVALFTDAGQYAIRFGDDVQSDKFAHLPFIISGYVGAHFSQLVNVSQKLQTKELHVVRQLTLPERVVALALAISLDSDYFSRRGGCVFTPFRGLPFLIATE
ncbi:scramblase-related [Zea mays]|uniref:Phospholipid scramblase n=1 Tax=Zea mays TaxID=4577 RepID=A0A1D6E0S4_MAIZE|nr:scramblase-related [Zea mays]